MAQVPHCDSFGSLQQPISPQQSPFLSSTQQTTLSSSPSLRFSTSLSSTISMPSLNNQPLDYQCVSPLSKSSPSTSTTKRRKQANPRQRKQHNGRFIKYILINLQ